MKRKLFLTSGGLPKDLRTDFLTFLNANPKKLTVAFVPTAADPEGDKEFVERARNELTEMGFSVVDIDLKKHDYASIHKALYPVDIIYVNGGNTFYLLYWIRKSGFGRAVQELVSEGRIYVGASAGSIVAGPDISPAGWEPGADVNDVKLDDLTGIGFVGFAISPHFQVDTLEKLQDRKSTRLNSIHSSI